MLRDSKWPGIGGQPSCGRTESNRAKNKKEKITSVILWPWTSAQRPRAVDAGRRAVKSRLDWLLRSSLSGSGLASLVSPHACGNRLCTYVTPMNNRTYSNLAFDISRPHSRAERIARIEWLSTLLDTAIVVPGTNIRFGLDALIGLVPGIGDAVTTLLALYIVREARALGAPRILIARMLANVALDGVVGAVPIAGDLFDVAWRANRRNVALLRQHLDRAERKHQRAKP
jgi:hypothetical protein